MSTEYQLSYTAVEIDERLGKISSLVSSVNGITPDEDGNVQIVISGSGNDVDLTDYATKEWVGKNYQEKGEELAAVLEEYAKIEDIPEAYTLPVGGDKLGGVKNGGNVVINTDGTMTVSGSADDESGNNHNICTFLDAYVAWCNGETFPIAFYGDSTFYGTNTSGAGYTFCDHLQSMLREECGANATVYRVAVSGHDLDNGINNFDSNFGANGTYANTKMIGIGYGINDRLDYSTYEDYKNGVYTKIETLIQKCFARGIQPFMVTSQATIECGVATEYSNPNDENNYYPLRDANAMNVCANGAKKELAEKYGIPLIDLNQATELYLINSEQPVDTIISDRLHFGNIGHAFEAGFLFSQIVPRVVCIDGKSETVISYARQCLRNAIPEDKLSYGGRMKLYANYTKSSNSDIKIFDAYVYVRDYPATIWAYRSAINAPSYVKIDGTKYSMTASGNDLGTIDVGLHHLEAYSGNGSVIDFAGFVVNDKNPIGPVVLCNSMSISGSENGFKSMEDTIVPVALMFGADATNTRTALSGNKIDSIYLNISAGTITIGKVNLAQYGSGNMDMISAQSHTINSSGYTTIDLGGMYIGETETLAIGAVGDTALPYYVKNVASTGSDAFICTSEVFKAGTDYAIGMKCIVYGR